MERVISGAKSRDEASGHVQMLCLVALAPEEVERLREPLVRHYREAGVEIEVIAERRNGDRRSGRERRKRDTGPPQGKDERRAIHNADGRRVGERRAVLIPTDPPVALPRKAQPHADRITFCERIPQSEEFAEDLDTARLVTRIQGGERELFATLYQRYFDRVYAYLRVMLRDTHEAEDVTQQVFVEIFEALPRYQRKRQPFRAWLFTIVRNQGVSQMRRTKRLDLTAPENLLRENAAASPAGPEEARAIEWISDQDLMLFVERLPLPQRQVLLLRFMLDLNANEIAEILERTPENVRILQHRALRFLEQRLVALGRSPRNSRRTRMSHYLRPANVIRARRFALR